MTIIVGGPMFQSADQGWRRSIYGKGGGHYNIFDSKDSVSAIVTLRDWFKDDDSVNEMNFILFSTSGIHGSYRTLEDIAESTAKYGFDIDGHDEWPDDRVWPEATFLLVQPRLVSMTFGNARIRDEDDLKWAFRVRELSSREAALIGTDDAPKPKRTKRPRKVKS